MVLMILTTTTQARGQVFRKFGGSVDRIPVAFDEMPNQQQLLAELKVRSEVVRQLSSNISVSMAGIPKIKGTLQIEFPDRMRMKAGLLGVSEMGVDVGSNREHFWIWTRASTPGQPPTFYFANHAAFERSPVRKSIPLDPKWLMEGLGVVRIAPTDVHHGPFMTDGRWMKFYTVRQTSTGRQTREMWLDVKTGLIEQQALYDASNQLIAYTKSSKYQSVTQDNRQASLPQRIELHMIQANGQDSKMVIDLGSISIEPLYGDPNKMWSMPNPDGINKIDLAREASQSPGRGFSANMPTPTGPPAQGVGYNR